MPMSPTTKLNPVWPCNLQLMSHADFCWRVMSKSKSPFKPRLSLSPHLKNNKEIELDCHIIFKALTCCWVLHSRQKAFAKSRLEPGLHIDCSNEVSRKYTVRFNCLRYSIGADWLLKKDTGSSPLLGPECGLLGWTCTGNRLSNRQMTMQTGHKETYTLGK